MSVRFCLRELIGTPIRIMGGFGYNSEKRFNNPPSSKKHCARGNLNIDSGTTIVMVTHDSQIASHTERMLLLQDGRITKEKQGLHLAKKKLMCPHCGSKIQPSDERCPNCKKRL